jgi:hydrogenase maturation protease
MTPILFIGIGNEFRQDDGAGVYIARELKKKKLEGVVIKEHRGEGFDLMDLWKVFKKVVLFDAVSSGAAPGSIHRFEIPPDEVSKTIFCCSTHAFSIADVINLAETLDQLPESLVVYGVEGKNFEQGEGLSCEVREAGQKIIKQVVQKIVSLA